MRTITLELVEGRQRVSARQVIENLRKVFRWLVSAYREAKAMTAGQSY